MKNLLALDTSSPALSIALKTRTGSIHEKKLVGFFKHAENILPLIDRLLKKKKLCLDNIDSFLIGRGPGSFTGLRVGFSALKGFMAVKKRPCLGALSLDMIAENADLAENAFLAVCLDAHRGKIYFRLYCRKKDRWMPVHKARVLTAEEILKNLPDGCTITGDALTRYGERFKTGDGRQKFVFLPETYWYPRSVALIHWFEKKDSKLVTLKRPKDFLPLYFRLSEAEEYRRKS